jgi:hypothetical protein
MSYHTSTISTETAGVCSVSMAISAEDTVITLDVAANGEHFKSHMTLEHSPDNINWFKSGQVTNGSGSMTLVIATAFVRACVVVGEGTAQTATIFITAK